MRTRQRSRSKAEAQGAAASERVAAEGTQGSAGPLPFLPQIQRAFGKHDVTAVRAYTGERAAAAAAELGARAYAIGDAVAFAGTPDLRTAAHEAAHVVQQRAGVSLLGGAEAGDRYEAHAEEVAEAVAQGEDAEALLDQLPAGARTRAVQRLVVPTPGAGAGVRMGAHDDSNVWLEPMAQYWVQGVVAATAAFGDGQVATINLPLGTSGTLQIYVKAHFFVDNALFGGDNDAYGTSFTANWNVSVAADGTLTIQDAEPLWYEPESAPHNQLYLGAVSASKGADYVQISIPMMSTTQSGASVNLPPVASTTASAGGRTWARDLRVHIQHPLAVTGGTARVQKSCQVLFGVDKDRLTDLPDSQVRVLADWWGGLNEATRRSISSGATPITLAGHASATGGSAHDVELSEGRVAAVKEILSGLAGDRAVFHTSYAGALEAATPGESDAERRVDVSVWESAPE